MSSRLDVQLSQHDWARRRSTRAHLLALLSIPVAVLARWPALGSELTRRAVLVWWLLGAVAAAWALGQEVWLGWRLMARWRDTHDDPGA
jgi:hypothetical protein